MQNNTIIRWYKAAWKVNMRPHILAMSIVMAAISFFVKKQEKERKYTYQDTEMMKSGAELARLAFNSYVTIQIYKQFKKS